MQPAARAPGILFDTDMGNDIDDALALAMLHALDRRGECRLLGVTISKDNPWAARYTALVNAFYGRPALPVGVVEGGKTPDDGAYCRKVAERRQPDGSPVYPSPPGAAAPRPAVEVLRRLLAAEPDGSVVVIQVGFSTNLARLLDSPADAASPLPGAALVARKVRLLSAMAGHFPAGPPEYNVYTDIPAARRVFDGWPGEIVFSGFEVGNELLYPALSIERDFGYAADHPVAAAYRVFEPMPYNRPCWDLTSVLHAVRGAAGYFALSPPGRVSVDDRGTTRFDPRRAGNHRYLILEDHQRARIREAFTLLASEPPAAGGHVRLE
jgi:inosine-uridine nucleoside N-ribohydrolase